MTYLIVQIAVFLVLAALLGFVVGWLLRGLRSADSNDDQARVEEHSSEAQPQDPFDGPPAWP